jgi:hypothetical protein
MMTAYQIMTGAEHASDVEYVEFQRREDKAERQEAVFEEELVEASGGERSPLQISPVLEPDTPPDTQARILLQQIRDELANPENLRIHDSYIVSAIDGFFKGKTGGLS